MNDYVYIYALKDPETGKCRYVGKSVNPKARLTEHIYLSSQKRTYRDCWIQTLVLKGRRPSLEILDVVPRDDWQFWESEYIRVFRALGIPLTNLTSGGEGLTNVSDETRKKIGDANRGRRGRKLSLEAKEKIGSSHRGRKHTLEARQNMSDGARGKVLSKKTRQKISLAIKGQKKSSQMREKMRAGWLVRKQAFGDPNFCQGSDGRFTKIKG